jgi:ABC-type multidrug transport system fused ATPase/permease subunit
MRKVSGKGGNLYYVWVSLLQAFLFAYGGMRAAAAIHGKLLRAVLRARMSFFDNTPLGRILNRSTNKSYKFKMEQNYFKY